MENFVICQDYTVKNCVFLPPMQHFIRIVSWTGKAGFKMLNLTIRAGDYFTIGDDIKVIILGGTRNNVKVMVDAPRNYAVVRGDVLEKEAATPAEREKLRKFYPEKLMTAQEIGRLIAKQNRS